MPTHLQGLVRIRLIDSVVSYIGDLVFVYLVGLGIYDVVVLVMSYGDVLVMSYVDVLIIAYRLCSVMSYIRRLIVSDAFASIIGLPGPQAVGFLFSFVPLIESSCFLRLSISSIS
jgi:hypothetical protein